MIDLQVDDNDLSWVVVQECLDAGKYRQGVAMAQRDETKVVAFAVAHLQAGAAAVAAVELEGTDAGIERVFHAEEVVGGLESVGLGTHGIVHSRENDRGDGEVAQHRRTIAWERQVGH